jgi:hypothetical protein
MRLFNEYYLSLVIAGSSKNSIFEDWELEQSFRPRFGRNWWIWVPTVNNNGGNFKKGVCTDLSFIWLCFSLSITCFRN